MCCHAALKLQRSDATKTFFGVSVPVKRGILMQIILEIQSVNSHCVEANCIFIRQSIYWYLHLKQKQVGMTGQLTRPANPGERKELLNTGDL